MKQLICEMCGGNDLIKQDGVFVCQNCGTKYTVEEAKKMMKEKRLHLPQMQSKKRLIFLRNI